MLTFATLSQLWRPAPPDMPPPGALPALAAPPEPLPTLAEENSAKVAKVPRAAKAKAKPREASIGEMLLILLSAGRPLAVSELAAHMGCSVGEASKRVTGAGNLVTKRRQGRCVLVSHRRRSTSRR